MKTIIYQIFTRLYGNRNINRHPHGTLEENGSGKFNDINATVLKRIRELGITHVWYTGVIRHATQTDYTKFGIPRQHPAVVKGRAGSPYAITDYYDVDPDLAVNVRKRMEEFEKLIKRTHRAGMKVIIDFVPNHVARQYHSICKPADVVDLGEKDDNTLSFDAQNNFYYCVDQIFQPGIDLYKDEPEPYEENPAKATGNDQFGASPSQNDWYETVKLNYGVDYSADHVQYFSPLPATWRQMRDILLFWSAKGVDGFRCDMAEMVPAEFWGWVTAQIKQVYPNIVFIGEVYNPSLYRKYLASGFDLLYDKVGMYDTLRAVTCNQASATSITQAWQSTDDIHDHMLYFLENHDEQRVASDFFAGNGENGVPALIVSTLMRTNPFMLYAGEEYGERGMDSEGFSGKDGRTTIFDYWSIDTLCRAEESKLLKSEQHLHEVHQRVLNIANKEKAVTEGVFFDLMYANPASDCFYPYSNYVFLRKAEDELMFVAVNFGTAYADVKVRIPAHAFNYLGLQEENVIATDLLTDDQVNFKLRRDGTLSMRIPAHGARVWKMTVNKTDVSKKSKKK